MTAPPFSLPLPTTPAHTVHPGLSLRLNLAFDLAVVLFALAVSTGGLLGVPLAIACTAVWIVGSTGLRHYAPEHARSPSEDVALASVLVLALTALLAVVGLVVPSSASPRLGLFLLTLWPAVVLARLAVFRALAHREQPAADVLIVGAGPLARATAEDLVRNGAGSVAGILRFASEPAPKRHFAGELGLARELESVLRRVAVDEVYVAGDESHHAEVQAAIRVCERLGTPFALPAYVYRFDRARLAPGQGIEDGYVHFVTAKPLPAQFAFKRLFDIVASFLALLLLSPLLLTVAALIKLTSRGPVLFRQERIGLHGKPFGMFKFRSMVVNAEELKAKLMSQNEVSGPVFKMKHDPRVTRVGRFIRKFSIDELPQLLNVLRGDMSVVGPRPPLAPEVAKYEPWQLRRLSVRPGLTCTWQVSGRSLISFEEWMYLDMDYIDHWSFWRDLKLIFATVPVVLTGKGAS